MGSYLLNKKQGAKSTLKVSENPIDINLINTLISDTKNDSLLYSEGKNNILSLEIKNNTESDLRLQSGAVIPEVATGNQFALYIDFKETLNKEEEFKQLVFTCENSDLALQQYCYIDDTDKNQRSWILTVSKDFILKSKKTLKFSISKIFCSSNGVCDISIFSRHFGYKGEDPDGDECKKTFSIVSPPAERDRPFKEFPLSAGFFQQTDNVYIYGENDVQTKNSLLFYLSNTDDKPFADAKSNKTKSEFRVFFIGSKGTKQPGSLTTYEYLSKITIRPASQYIKNEKNKWEVEHHIVGGLNWWSITTNNPEILGVGDQSSVEFRIDDVTVDSVEGTTLMYIQAINIPGYQNGRITIPIHKSKPRPGILKFFAESPSIEQGNKVILTWETLGGKSIQLDCIDSYGTKVSYSNNSPNMKIPFNTALIKGALGFVHEPNSTTTYRLTLINDENVKITEDRIVTVIEPKIKTFKANPEFIGFKGETKLSWQTNADRCVLTTSSGDIPVDAPNGSIAIQTTKKTIEKFVLRAYRHQNPEPAETSVQVTVEKAEDKDCSFTSSANGTVESYLPVTLTWKTKYASACKLEPDIGYVEPLDSGKYIVYPQNNTTFTLTIENRDQPIIKTVNINVYSVEIKKFNVNKTKISAGEEVEFEWEISRARHYELIFEWCDTLKGAPTNIQNPELKNGKYKYKFGNTLKVTLKAYGPNGPVLSKTIQINVTDNPEVKSLSVSALANNKYQIKFAITQNLKLLERPKSNGFEQFEYSKLIKGSDEYMHPTSNVILEMTENVASRTIYFKESNSDSKSYPIVRILDLRK